MTGAGAVVTGIGVIAPNGIGVDDYWDATLAGRSGLGVISRFDSTGYPARVGGEVLAFDAADHLPKRLLPQTDRMTQYALAVTDWAIEDSGIHLADYGEFDAGVVTASGSGGFEFGQHELQKLWRSGPERVSAYQSFAWFYAVNSGQISIRNGLRGHSSVVVAEQAGGIDATAQAARLVRNGTLKVALSGGFEASLCPWGLVAQIPSGLLSTVADPARAYLPFDCDASGWVAGEGGAIMVLEGADEARSRDARVYGRIAGHASTFDPRPGSGRPAGLVRAVRSALARAEVEPADVDVVFADAAGVPDLDYAETCALTEVFGVRAVPVTAPKTMTGRLSAGAALDIATALLAMRDGVVPPTVGTRVPSELDLVVGVPRELAVRTVLVVARGYGGFNSALVLENR